ncbi:MAG: M48 family metallopeptidase [Gammaproteobacteria bacterium]|nr:M48 family metallopeptidase [Gammaproteobacteria bacterium]
MNFFEYQDAARSNTKKLVLLFVLAVISLIILTYLLFLVVAQGALGTGNLAPNSPGMQHDWVTFGYIAGGVVALVTLGSLYRIASLSSGGASVAEMLDGELLTDAGGDFKRRRLLNVVEEMAIASGTPVPPVYIIDEAGINAFAAGYSPNDAVVGITQGAIDHLSRDELQGVIAHEFSHILNGDMRLNIRLMGVLYGILLLTVIGRIILRGSRGSSRSKNGGGIVAVGLGLLVIGYVGYFFGGLIKAAVSRQREFLADASAVQFTRNPRGIGGALKRIGGYEPGGVMENPKADEIGHALFASYMRNTFSSLLATHPPLDERIARIDPAWSGEFQYQDDPAVAVNEPGQEGLTSGFAGPQTAENLDKAVDRVGELTPENISMAQGMIASIPAVVRASIGEPWGARAVIYLLLLSEDKAVCSSQLDYLHSEADKGVFQEIINLAPALEDVDDSLRLPMMELAMPALRQLSRNQRALFRNNVQALIRADGRVDLFEWSLQKILTTALDSSEKHRHVRAKYGSFSGLVDHVSLVISMLIYSNKVPEEDRQQLMDMTTDRLKVKGLYLYERSRVTLKKLDEAVEVLRGLKPLKKPVFLKVCAAIIMAGKGSAASREMLRAISEMLDCPMPPLR